MKNNLVFQAPTETHPGFILFPGTERLEAKRLTERFAAAALETAPMDPEGHLNLEIAFIPTIRGYGAEIPKTDGLYTRLATLWQGAARIMATRPEDPDFANTRFRLTYLQEPDEAQGIGCYSCPEGPEGGWEPPARMDRIVKGGPGFWMRVAGILSEQYQEHLYPTPTTFFATEYDPGLWGVTMDSPGRGLPGEEPTTFVFFLSIDGSVHADEIDEATENIGRLF